MEINHGHRSPAEGSRFRDLPHALPLPEREIGDWEPPSRQCPGGKGEATTQVRMDWNRIISTNALYWGKKEDS